MKFPESYVTSGLLATSKLTAGDFKVYFALIAGANRDGLVEHTQATISTQTGMARKNVRVALDHLVAEGLIERTSSQGKRATYMVNRRPFRPSTLPDPTTRAVWDENVNGYAPELGPSEGAKNLAPTTGQVEEVEGNELGPSEGAKLGTNLAPLKVPSVKTNASRAREYVNPEDLVPAPRTLREIQDEELLPSLGGAGDTPAYATERDTFTWGFRGQLGQAHWDEYAPLYERAYGFPLEPENTKFYPDLDTYDEAIANLRGRAVANV